MNQFVTVTDFKMLLRLICASFFVADFGFPYKSMNGRFTAPTHQRSQTLNLKNDFDDGPLIDPIDELPQKFKLKTLEELRQQSSAKNFRNDDIEPAREYEVSKRSATFGYLSIDELKGRMIEREAKPYFSNPNPNTFEQKLVDLNGINPATPLLFSILPALMSFAGYMLSNYMSANFAVDYLSSEYYPVQRIAIVARNVIVGLCMMGTGFSGMVAIGLIGLGVSVSIGVLKGELNPDKSLTANIDK